MGGNIVIKRLFDLVVALVLLMVYAPALLIIAIVIRLDSPGPILYLSERVGKNGKLFCPYRFRTMDIHKPTHLSAEERLTHVGRFIRNYSLDHLPTWFNVLKGEMSVVGPRPEMPEYVDLEDPTWQSILTVKPGMISLAVYRLGRKYNASSQPVRQKIELEYIQKQSLMFDLWMFLKSGQALIASKGNVKARGEPFPELEDS
jgi:lipopolysaccharide/colanic/teichoic acid biosynthesis glycosyltransferase